jgi:Zn-dependent protease
VLPQVAEGEGECLGLVREPGNTLQNLLITLAGPMTNLILAWAAWHSTGFVGKQWFLANLVIGGYNLLPVKGSDGNRAIKLVLEYYTMVFAKRTPGGRHASFQPEIAHSGDPTPVGGVGVSASGTS